MSKEEIEQKLAQIINSYTLTVHHQTQYQSGALIFQGSKTDIPVDDFLYLLNNLKKDSVISVIKTPSYNYKKIKLVYLSKLELIKEPAKLYSNLNIVCEDLIN